MTYKMISPPSEEPLTLDDGSERTFLADGDTIVLRASAPGRDGGVIGLGECAPVRQHPLHCARQHNGRQQKYQQAHAQ